jgi:hypothetical protein
MARDECKAITYAILFVGFVIPSAILPKGASVLLLLPAIYFMGLSIYYAKDV